MWWHPACNFAEMEVIAGILPWIFFKETIHFANFRGGLPSKLCEHEWSCGGRGKQDQWQSKKEDNALKVVISVAISVNVRIGNPANICLCSVNNGNTKKRCEIRSKLKTKKLERRQWRHSGVFNINFEHISHLFLVFILRLWARKCYLQRL